MGIFRKSLLIVLINVVYIQAQATIEDAQQALAELDALSLEIQGSIHLLMNEQADIMRAELNAQRTQGTQLIDDQLANITNKISTMAESISGATGRPVGECVRSSDTDLQTFGTEWKGRLEQCFGFMIQRANYLLYTVWNSLWYEYDIDYYCSHLVLNECERLQQGQCPDAVMSAIQNARTSMNRSAELFRAEMSNQIIGLHFPCIDLANEALIVYPPLILEFAKSCFDQIVASSYSFGC